MHALDPGSKDRRFNTRHLASRLAQVRWRPFWLFLSRSTASLKERYSARYSYRRYTFRKWGVRRLRLEDHQSPLWPACLFGDIEGGLDSVVGPQGLLSFKMIHQCR